jgi:hypothetical protein
MEEGKHHTEDDRAAETARPNSEDRAKKKKRKFEPPEVIT